MIKLNIKSEVKLGFYDKEIKKMCESCPRLFILMINSIFQKHHAEDAEIIFLDKEQNINSHESTTYMDMLISIENCHYHIEYQLLEGNMAIRMVEYGLKETVREMHHFNSYNPRSMTIDGDISRANNGRYEIEIFMPLQAVVFLAGANKEDKILVKLHLPDGKLVTYDLPCVSASLTVSELSKKHLYLLIPFQQVQLYNKVIRARRYSKNAKLKLAEALYKFRQDAKKELDNLYNNGILKKDEVDILNTSLRNIEDNLLSNDEIIREKVTEMGDEDYVALSDRLIQQGIEQGMQQGVEQTLLTLVAKKLEKNKTISQIADECEISEAEVAKYIELLKK